MENDSIQTIVAKSGKPFDIMVPSQATSGYETTLDFNESVFELLGRKHTPADTIGGSGQTVFTFVSQNETEDKISAFYKRPFGTEQKMLAQTYAVKVLAS